MYANPIVTTARSLLKVAAFACTFSVGNVVAVDRVATIELHVRADGLDLSQTVDATTFYARIKHAAWVGLHPWKSSRSGPLGRSKSLL
jgi:hypothetical protein